MTKTPLLFFILFIVVQSKIGGSFTTGKTNTTAQNVSQIVEQTKGAIPYGWASTDADTFAEEHPLTVSVAQAAVQFSYAPQLIGNQYEGLSYVYTQKVTGSTNYALILQYGTMITSDIYFEVTINSAFNQVLAVVPLGIKPVFA